MSEVDKHYGAGSTDTHRFPGDEPAREAVQKADSALKGAADAAGRTVGDLAGRTVRAAGQVRDSVSGGVDRATDWAQDSYENVARNATYARRRTVGEFNRGRRGVESFVEENPIMIGVAGLAAGLLIGALLPGTRRENQAFGRYADEVKREGVRYAQDLAQHGREVVAENLRGLASRDGQR